MTAMKKYQIGIFELWILMISVHGVVFNPVPSKNQHDPQNKESKTTVGTNNYDEDKFFKTFWLEKNKGLCPYGQVPHRNNTVCCYVTTCGPGYQISECERNGTEDKCTPCKFGFLQLNNISSFDMEDAKCFKRLPNHNDCPIQDMRPSKENVFMDPFGINCECKHEVCYIEKIGGATCILKKVCKKGRQLNRKGKDFRPYWKEFDSFIFPYPCECLNEKCLVKNNVGSCDQTEECYPNFQLNRLSGTCELCPWYAYKFERGCQPCTFNLTLLRQGRPEGKFNPFLSSTTTEKVTGYSKSSHTSNDNQSFEVHEKPNSMGINGNGSDFNTILVAVLVGAFVLLTICFGLILYILKRKRSQGVSIPPSTPTNDSAPLLRGQMPVTILEQNGLGSNGLESTLFKQNVPNSPYNDHVNSKQEYHVNGYGGNILVNGVENTSRNGFVNGTLNHEGNLPLEADGVQEEKGDDDETLKTCDQNNEKRKESVYNTRDVRTEMNNLQQVEAVNKMHDKNNKQHVNLEEEDSEGLQGAVGGTPVTFENGKDDVKDSKPKQESKTKTTFSFHNNVFKDCKIQMYGRARASPDSSSDKVIGENPVSLTSLSGTFDANSSINSTVSLSSSPTVLLRKLEPDREDRKTDSDELKQAGNIVSVEKVDIGSGQRGPPCRPELSNTPLSGGQGCDVRKDTDKNDEQDCKKMEKITKDSALNIVQQFPCNKERKVARVEPIRQNSEVRHISGYPSEVGDAERNTVPGSVPSSMSYAIMHADSEFNTGFMGQPYNARNGDLSEFDSNDSFYQHSNVNSMRSVRGNGENGFVPGMNVNQVGVANIVAPMNVREMNGTCPVQPMGEREGPEGRSITYMPDNDNFSSVNDMEETNRKVIGNETDPDVTDLKQIVGIDTHAKLIDTDDDITEQKRKIKESQINEEKFDIEKKEEHGKTLTMNESIDIKKDKESASECNVEDILYDDISDESKSVVTEKTGEEEKSFELESSDVKNILTAYEDCSEVTNKATYIDDETSRSFEIKSDDIKVVDDLSMKNKENLNDQVNDDDNEEEEQGGDDDNGCDLHDPDNDEKYGRLEQTEESFELNSHDIDHIVNEETSRPVKDDNDKVDADVKYCSRESSFELSSFELNGVNVEDSTDKMEAGDKDFADDGSYVKS